MPHLFPSLQIQAEIAEPAQIPQTAAHLPWNLIKDNQHMLRVIGIGEYSSATADKAETEKWQFRKPLIMTDIIKQQPWKS